jgi:hypothetical protein
VLVAPAEQPPCPCAISVVLAGKLGTQQRFFGTDTGDQRRNGQQLEHHADPGAKHQSLTQAVDEQSRIAGVTDNPVGTIRDQRMPWPDGHQRAEPAAEYEDRPESQRAPRGKENDAKPADGISVDGPKSLALRAGRQIRIEQPDHGESDDDPPRRPSCARRPYYCEQR